MGGSPPPPPPARQPYNQNKEDSMYFRNLAFSNAVTAATDSYTAAIIVKTLADILLPITDRQLRQMIDFHFNVVAEYRRAQIVYTTTVATFYEVDTLVKASIDKLKMIQNVGETYLDDYDNSVLKYITTEVGNIYKLQNDLQNYAVEANDELEKIRVLYNGSNTGKTQAELDAEYNTRLAKINTLCTNSTTVSTTIASKIAEMKRRLADNTILDMVVQSKTSMAQTIPAVNQNLQDTNRQIQARIATNIEGLMKELETRNRWYAFYRRQADEVENRNQIAIRPAMFIRLLNWAKHSHWNAIHSALHALSANAYAYQDRNWP
jgi:hypothetical protein